MTNTQENQLTDWYGTAEDIERGIAEFRKQYQQWKAEQERVQEQDQERPEDKT